MHQIIISVGSNIEPKKNCRQAMKLLIQKHLVLGQSRFSWTSPVGYQDQANFLNGAFYIQTQCDIDAFNHHLKQIEKKLGRVKGAIKSGPRTINLDLIIWNGWVVRPEDYYQEYVYPFVQELIDSNNIELIQRSLPLAS